MLKWKGGRLAPSQRLVGLWPRLERVKIRMYFVYFAKSLRNGKIYVGFTSKDPTKRVQEHNQSSNKWSSQNKPLKLVYHEAFICKEDALNREKFYKTGVGKRIKKAICREMDD